MATTVHTFAAFHYDVAYQKTYRGYLPQTLKIIRAGIRLLQRHPEYVFNIEQVIVLREYWKRYPRERAAIKRLAKGGRLVFAPGMFTMPDVNLPNGESFFRNFEMGRDWLVEHLGVEPKVCWMADIFGHHPQMPQIAKLCGYNAYMFERGKTQGDDTIFWWQGIDGTRLVTAWEHDTYYGIGLALMPDFQPRGKNFAPVYAEKMLLKQLRARSRVKDLVISPLGGDFRMPTGEDVAFVKEFNRQRNGFAIKFSSPDRYFEQIAKRNLPVLRADFNPLMQGTYSSRITVKQANRRLENLAYAIELLGGNVKWLWERISFNAFHDIICGSLAQDAIAEAYKDYRQTERAAARQLRQSIVRRSPRTAKTTALILNPLPYPRTEVIQIGRKLAQVKLPATSITAFRPGKTRTGKLIARPDVLENSRLRAVFGKNGTIISLFDKENGNELAVPIRGDMFEMGMNDVTRESDFGDLWSLYTGPVNGSLLHTAPLHDPLPISNVELQRHGGVGKRAVEANSFGWPDIRIVERGPLRGALEIKYRLLNLVTTVSLAHDEKMLRFTTRFVPKGRYYRLRVAFPTTIPKGKIRSSIPCGHITRPEGEYPAQDWIDYSDGKKGLLLLNRGLPGNNVTNGVMMLSLFRAVAMEHIDKRPWFEAGVEQVFEYALRPFGASDKDYNPTREAARYAHPPVVVPAKSDSDGVSLVELDGDNAELMAYRAGELRLHESHGRRGWVTLRFPSRVISCVKTDARGIGEGQVKIDGRVVALQLKPFEIVTLRLELEHA